MGSIEAARVEEEKTGERSENERGSTYCEKCKMDLAPFLKGGEFRCPIHGHPETLDDRNSFVLEEKEGGPTMIPIKKEESSVTKEQLRDYIRRRSVRKLMVKLGWIKKKDFEEEYGTDMSLHFFPRSKPLSANVNKGDDGESTKEDSFLSQDSEGPTLSQPDEQELEVCVHWATKKENIASKKDAEMDVYRFHRRVVCCASLDIIFGFVGLFVFCVGAPSFFLGATALFCTYRYAPNITCGYKLAKIGFAFIPFVIVGFYLVIIWAFAEVLVVQCKQPAPGLIRMQMGVDATKLDLFAESGNDNGFMAPLFELSCSEGKKFKYKKETYDLPDHISGMNSVPSGAKHAKTQVYTSLKQVEESMSASIGGGDTLGMFSASASYSNAHTQLSTESKKLATVTAFVSVFRADNKNSLSMRFKKSVQNVLDTLGEPYEKAPNKYKKFIRKFGTHYFSDVSLGGVLRLTTSIDESKFEETDESTFEAQAAGAFSSVNAELGFQTSNKDTHQESDSLEEKKTSYFGGEKNLMEGEDGFLKWQPSVEKNPWIYKGQITPIYEVVKDETIKKELRIATQAHLDEAYLESLLMKIGSAEKNLNGPKPETTMLTQAIETERDKNPPNHDQVIELGRKMEYYLIIPSWFKNFQICFQWNTIWPNYCDYYQEDKGQKSLCAGPGEWTPNYNDVVKKDSGCYLAWSLDMKEEHMKYGVDDYFKNTKICHKWVAKGAETKQCNGVSDHEPHEECAEFGKFTAPFKDESQVGDGGCDHSWKIMIPVGAPVWLTTIKFCMKWYNIPDVFGKIRQALAEEERCGANDIKEFCIGSNAWSPIFNDDGTGRRSTCFLSWKITVENPGVGLSS